MQADEVARNVEDLAQFRCHVLLAEVTDVEPQVRSIRRLDALAIAHLLRHVAGDNVAARKLLLVRLQFHHEAVQVLIEQVAAVAAATLGEQDAARYKSGRMKLHGLHVAQRHDAGIERDSRTHTLVDRGVGRELAVDAAVAARCNDRRFRKDRVVLAGAQAAGNGTPAS